MSIRSEKVALSTLRYYLRLPPVEATAPGLLTMRTDDLVVPGSEAVAGAAEGENLLAQKATDIQV